MMLYFMTVRFIPQRFHFDTSVVALLRAFLRTSSHLPTQVFFGYNFDQMDFDQKLLILRFGFTDQKCSKMRCPTRFDQF
jgi:hypothetical protein